MNTSKYNKSFSIDIKSIALILLLLYIGCNQFISPERVEKEVKETETVDIKEVVEKAINNRLHLQEPSQQPVIVYRDRVVPVNSSTIVPKEDLDKLKNLNKYQDTTKLKNATIYSEILTDGKIYSNKITANVPVKTITKTKETKITKYASGLYLSPGVNVSPLGIKNAELGLNYIYKADFGVGAAIQYNFNDNTMNYGIKIHKKIF